VGVLGPAASELVGLKLQIPVTVRIKRATTQSGPLAVTAILLTTVRPSDFYQAHIEH
jgi:hypothetical protein